jgi:hypothetical protein
MGLRPNVLHLLGPPLGCSALLGDEFVPCLPIAGSLAPFASGKAGFLGSEFVCSAFLMGSLSAFATCFRASSGVNRCALPLA